MNLSDSMCIKVNRRCVMLLTNVASLNVQKNLFDAQSRYKESMQKLSTGLRITTAKDDAAGLAISESMSSQIRGMAVGIRNANDGMSMAQTVESNLTEVTSALQRIRELAVQSSNGTYTTNDRMAYGKEVEQLKQEIGRILDRGQFNGKGLFSSSSPGWTSSISFQIGYGKDDKIEVNAIAVRSASAITNVSALSVSSLSAAQSAIAAVDAALKFVNETRATWGAVQSRFESIMSNARDVIEATEASRSRIRDVDFAAETANLTKNQIMTQASMAMLTQANAFPQSVLQLLG
jgi:flagellin